MSAGGLEAAATDGRLVRGRVMGRRCGGDRGLDIGGGLGGCKAERTQLMAGTGGGGLRMRVAMQGERETQRGEESLVAWVLPYARPDENSGRFSDPRVRPVAPPGLRYRELILD